MTLDRRSLFRAGAAAAALPVLATPLGAVVAAPVAPLPGLRAFGVGEARVLALSDGYLELATALFPSADAAEVGRLQGRAFLPRAAAIRTAVNAYLVETGGRTVLVDSGTADAFGPTLGKVHANLAAAGIAPAAVDVIAMTHLHPDHVNGIVAADGAAAFPNAELVVHEADWAFWTDEAAASRAPEEVKPFFAGAQRAVKPYAAAGRVRRVVDGAEVVPGMTAVALPGHTPGHTGFRLASGSEQLLIWGDVVHVQALQLAHPDWSIAFDTDPAQAAAVRARALDMVSADGIAVAGMHLDFPGFGHVAREGGAYAFVPARWF